MKKMKVNSLDVVYDLFYGYCTVIDVDKDTIAAKSDFFGEYVYFDMFGVLKGSKTGIRSLYYSREQVETFGDEVDIDFAIDFIEFVYSHNNKSIYNTVIFAFDSLKEFADNICAKPSELLSYIYKLTPNQIGNGEVFTLDKRGNIEVFLDTEDFEKIVFKLLSEAVRDYRALFKRGYFEEDVYGIINY